MRSNAIVIGRIVFQNPAQMLLAQDNDVVQTLAPDRSDQPFGKAILPRRSWCDRLVPDPTRSAAWPMSRVRECLAGFQGDTGYPIPSRIGHRGATIWPHRRFKFPSPWRQI